jgi:hypothetical protein
MPSSNAMPRRAPLVVGAALLLAVAWCGTARAAPPTLPGPPVDAGAVTVVSATDTDDALNEGASATIFSLALPDGATCPGDSEHDQWRIQSFIIPVADDPGTLTYNDIGPEGDALFALYEVDENPYVNILLDSNAAPGSPGRIPQATPLSFAVFPPGTLPAGSYRIGLACTYFRHTAVYWDTEFTLVADPDDEPGQLTWSVPGAPSGDASSGGGRGWAPPLLAGIAVLVLLTAGAAWRQRNRSLVKEHA